MFRISAYRAYHRFCCKNRESDGLLRFVRCRRALEDASEELERRKKAIEESKKNGVPAEPLTSEEEAQGRAMKTCDWLYIVLNTLDNKASALMRLSGVMVAAVSFLSAEHVPVVALIVSAGPSTLSIFCCLFVVSLDWSFYHFVDISGDKPDFRKELFHLQNIAIFRENMYRTAWTLSLVGIASFFLCLSLAFASMVSTTPNDTPNTNQPVTSSSHR